MNNMKKVSIILPVYNGEEYLEKALDSIICQTYENWELIIVNDCSTDRTEAIVSDYVKKDNRIKLFTNFENLKLPKSLNVGFEHATGDYYTWTSHDNNLKPTMIETLVSFLENNPDYGMVYSDFTYISDNGDIIGKSSLGEPKELLYGNQVGASFMYRSEIAHLVGGYDPNLFLAEDYEYWLRIFFVAKVYHLKKDLYDYRVHSESLSKKNNYVSRQVYKAVKKNFIQMVECFDSRDERLHFYFHWFNHFMKEDRKEVKGLLREINSFCFINVIWKIKRRITRRKEL